MSKTMYNTKIQDSFWTRYLEIVRKEMIPYQWKVLNDLHLEEGNPDKVKSQAIDNLKIAAGLKEGNFYGWIFQDSDVYKWLEAVAFSLYHHFDADLKDLADEVVDLIALAQEKDGYLHSYFTIEEPERKYRSLEESHELYCAGHFIEAAVAYYEVTKNEKVLSIACKLADHLDNTFGNEENKVPGYDGHEEVELALIKLYETTGTEKYLKLANFFIYERGATPNFLLEQRKDNESRVPLIEGMREFSMSYYQAHDSVLNHDEANGHAVRVVYLCIAMADVAHLNQDEEMLVACKKLWKNIVKKRMYITGGVGSTGIGEAFTLDYDLPNDTMYCETCASIGLIFFAFNMLKNEVNSEYADVMERALYNSVISGMSLDGKHFFYVNPMEIHPESVAKDPRKIHVKATRPEWYGCACCPPNIARMISSLQKYIYTIKNDTIYTNLFISNETKLDINGQEIILQQETNYPWDGLVKFKIVVNKPSEFTLGIRIPNWSKEYTLKINGNSVQGTLKNGYLELLRKWENNDEIEIEFNMSIRLWTAHPRVIADVNKVAVQRGPIVYCVEEVDNGNNLHLLRIPTNPEFNYAFDENLLGGVGVVELKGEKIIIKEKWEDTLYLADEVEEVEEVTIKMIPYYAWVNRTPGEMAVWMNKE